MPEPIVADILRQSLDSLTPSERRVARVLLGEYPAAGLDTAARLGERAGVSAPTVVRLVAKLNFSGYPQFQQRLRTEIAERGASPLQQYAAPRDAGPLEGVIARSERILCRGITESLTGLSQERLDAALDLICNPAVRLHIIGGRYSALVAEYLFKHLQLLRPGCSRVPDAAMDRAATLLDLARRDVVIAYDFRRHQDDTIHYGQTARDQGASLILFTDPWLSPLAERADVVLTCSVQAPSPFDALTPALAVTETLIAGVVDRLGEKARQRFSKFESYQTSAEQHWPPQ